jgi:hypothetical protein
MLTLSCSPHTSRTLSLGPKLLLSSICYSFHFIYDGFAVLASLLVLRFHVLHLFTKKDPPRHHATSLRP